MSATEPVIRDLENNPGHWLNDLQFYLGPDARGRYVFSRVRLRPVGALRQQEAYLQNLMTGRTIAEILEALTPAATASGSRLPDCTTAADLRGYFRHLALQLHLPPTEA